MRASGWRGEGVDRLRRVPDDADVAPLAQPQVEQGLLEAVDVLVLVDDEVPVLVAHRPGHLLVLAQDADHEEQDVLEVDDAPVGLDLLVGRDEAGHRRGIQTGRGFTSCCDGCRRVGLGSQQRHLRPLDLGGQVTDGGAVQAQPQAGAGLGDGTGLVRHHLRRRTADRLGPEIVQLAQGCRVEGAGLDPAHPEVAQAGAHLTGGPGREGDGQDPLGLVHPGQHAVRDAVGDGSGLARAGAGEHAHRATRVSRDLALLGVECIEDRVGSGVHWQAAHRP